MVVYVLFKNYFIYILEGVALRLENIGLVDFWVFF